MAAFPMAAVPPIFADLFALAVEHAASDLHLKVGRPALVRVAGQLVETEMSPFTAATVSRVKSSRTSM
jgi:Tfp pilus assembly pilus retraction ATPase PilT